MSKLSRAIVFLATALCLFAWARLGYETLTQLSPAREVVILTHDGAVVEADTFYCHGPAYLDRGSILRVCQESGHRGSSGTYHLVRFDLSRGVGQIVGPLPEVLQDERPI